MYKVVATIYFYSLYESQIKRCLINLPFFDRGKNMFHIDFEQKNYFFQHLDFIDFTALISTYILNLDT